MPPLVGVAVNVTLVPEQIVIPGVAAIFTLAGKLALTVIVSVFDVAGEPVAHDKLLVISHVVLSLFANAVEV